jgi:hypothetical protein
MVSIKAAVVCFAIAEMLFGIGLIEHDPWVWLQQHTSYRASKS